MILQKIRDALGGDLPPTHRRIAVYILENDRSVGFSSIHSLSKAIGVSNASVMRFTKSLGLEGYAEFKRAIQEEMIRRDKKASMSRMNDTVQVERGGYAELGTYRET